MVLCFFCVDGDVTFRSPLGKGWLPAQLTYEDDLIRWCDTGIISPLVEDLVISKPTIKDAKISWEMTPGVIKIGNGAENRMLIGSMNKGTAADKTNKDDSRVVLNVPHLKVNLAGLSDSVLQNILDRCCASEVKINARLGVNKSEDKEPETKEYFFSGVVYRHGSDVSCNKCFGTHYSQKLSHAESLDELVERLKSEYGAGKYVHLETFQLIK